MTQTQTTISEESANRQISAFFDYYNEDFEEILRRTIEDGKTFFTKLCNSLQRSIMKGQIELTLEESGYCIKQHLCHKREKTGTIVYEAINGETALYVASLKLDNEDEEQQLTKIMETLGKTSGKGKNFFKSLSAKDWSIANTVYSFLSIFG